MARFYSNENFPLPAVLELRRLGHDVLTSQDAGNAYRAVSDEAVLSYAHQRERAVLTLNRRHFIRLHQEHPRHHGIVVCSVDPDFSTLAERIHTAVSSHTTLGDQLIRVQRPNR